MSGTLESRPDPWCPAAPWSSSSNGGDGRATGFELVSFGILADGYEQENHSIAYGFDLRR
jgi:hypothetical protein